MSLLATLLAAEDPSQTHHWLLPEQAELIYGIAASAIVIGVLIWKAGPIAKKAMENRTATDPERTRQRGQRPPVGDR